MARAYVQWSMWTVRLLCWSTLWMAATGDEVASNAAVKYWETMLHGGVMPSTIQAMLSPLTSRQTTQLLFDINAYYLPTHAAAFCEVAHIQCGPNITNNPFATTEPSSDIFGYHYNKAGPNPDKTLVKLPASDVEPDVFGYHYNNKASPKKLPTLADASPMKVPASDGDIFGYHYNNAGPKKLPTSDASPLKLPASDGDVFGYHYNKDGPKKLPTLDASPEKLPASDGELFGYHYNKDGPKKLPTSDASPEKLPASDGELFGYHYNKDGPKKLPTLDTSPEKFPASDGELFGYYYNKGDPKKLPTSDASPMKVPASDGDIFGYHYNKDGPKKLPTLDASPKKLPISDGELFGYHYNKDGPKKLSTFDASPEKLPASDGELFGYYYNKGDPKKLHTSDASPMKLPALDDDIFGYHYNKAGPKKLPTFDASPVKLPASDGDIFGYHYNKASPKQLHTSDASPVKLPGSDGDIFGYHYNEVGPKKLPTLDASPIKLPTSDGDIFGYHYNKDGPQKLPASDAALLVGPKLKMGGARSLMSSTIHEISGSFFREKQVLVSGSKIYMNLATYKSIANDERAFLPRKLAQVFPISNEGVEKISHMLGFAKESLQVTVDHCNARNNMSGEVISCLASVEDISDFVSSIMGSKKTINAYDSIRNARTVKFSGKTFIVASVKPVKKDIDEPAITCHDMNFPFRVFYCHYALKTKIFDVKLQGEDGTSHERLAVCHYDTTYWNPEHVSFTDLHTKPGEAEACHWLGKNWIGQSGWVFSYA